MGNELVSHIPELLAKKKWSVKKFKAHCMLEGLSDFTAMRLANGDTNVNTETLLKVKTVLGVDSISELIEFDGEH